MLVGNISSEFLVLGFICVFFVVLIFLISLFVRTYLQSRSVSSQVDKLETRLKVITSGALGMGERIVELEAKLTELADAQQNVSSKDADFSYSQALRLLEQGVDEKTVAVNCGMSNSEVSLMNLVNASASTDIDTPAEEETPKRSETA